MSGVRSWVAGLALAGLGGVLLLAPGAGAAEVGFVEDFALARDRTAALRQLIPGTEDYYYYHALHYLNTAQFDKAEALHGPWHHRHGQTARLTEVQVRQQLLSYDRQPEKTLAFLRSHLGLRFDHQKETVNAAVNLPTALDQALISRDRLRDGSLGQWNNLGNFEDAALDWLAAQDLPWDKRRALLARLARPDIPNLPKMVAEDMAVRGHEVDFGAHPVHRQLTLAQLDELLRLRPDLLNHGHLVTAYLTKLQPGADDDWRRDRAVTRAYLDRLQTFVDRLAPAHNPLKAHVLFHRLAFDRAGGVYDRDRFLAYVKLPRFQPYMSARFGDREECRRHPATLTADYSAATLLPAVGADEPLVRAYLKHFLADDKATTKPYEEYLDDTWLRNVFAEARVERGAGDPEEWADRLPPELFRALRDRVDIDFAPTNKTDFAADEAVSLDLHVKNVPALVVKVFEVNTKAVYRARLREVDTDLNLDGLVANSERVYRYDDPPFRRADRRFAFPEMANPGVYVVDFIGAGKSSRALVRKGHLRPVATNGTAGQSVRVVDERNRPVNDATLWLAGAEYAPDKDGVITVPYSADPGRRPVVLQRGEFAALDVLDHRPEAYRLAAGIHVDRESLLAQRVAPIVVRAGLFLNDTRCR